MNAITTQKHQHIQDRLRQPSNTYSPVSASGAALHSDLHHGGHQQSQRIGEDERVLPVTSAQQSGDYQQIRATSRSAQAAY